MKKRIASFVVFLTCLIITLCFFTVVGHGVENYTIGGFHYTSHDYIDEIYVNGVKQHNIITSTFDPSRGTNNSININLREGKNVVAVKVSRNNNASSHGFIGRIQTGLGTKYTTGMNTTSITHPNNNSTGSSFPADHRFKGIFDITDYNWYYSNYNDSGWSTAEYFHNDYTNMDQSIFPPTYVGSTIYASRPYWIWPKETSTNFNGMVAYFRYTFYTANEPTPTPTPTPIPTPKKPSKVNGNIYYYGIPSNADGVIDVTKSEILVKLPLYNSDIELCQTDSAQSSGYKIIKTLQTNSSGQFSTTDLTNVTANGGSLFVRVKAEDGYSRVKELATNGSEYPIVYESPRYTLSSGEMNLNNLEINNVKMSGAFNIMKTINNGAQFWKQSMTGLAAPVKREVLMIPDGNNSTFIREKNQINYNEKQAYSPSFILHEYGHALMDQYGAIPINSGGNHTFYTIKTNGNFHTPQLAYSEGWAWFFSTSVLRSPVVYLGNVRMFDIETLASYSQSSNIVRDIRNEVSNAAVLWDLADTTNEKYNTKSSDTVSSGFYNVSKTVLDNKLSSGKMDMMSFWEKWKNGFGKNIQSASWKIFCEYNIKSSDLPLKLEEENIASISSGTTLVSYTGGIVKLLSTNIDPMIYMNNTGYFDPNEYRYFRLEYKMPVGTSQTPFQVYVMNDKYPSVTTEAQSVTSQNLIADGQWHTYLLDMYNNPEYRVAGRVTGWRLDYAATSGVTMEIKNTGLVTEEEKFFEIKTPSSDFSNDIINPEKATIYPGDFNGDKITDFIAHSDTKLNSGLFSFSSAYLRYYISKGNGDFDAYNFAAPYIGLDSISLVGSFLSRTYISVIPGDYNGDGITDLACQWKDIDTLTINGIVRNFWILIGSVNSSGTAGFSSAILPDGWDHQDGISGFYTNLIPGDFNGDGKTDLIRQEKNGWDDDNIGTFQVYFSKGDGTFDVITPQNPSYQTDMKGDYVNIIPGDFNGDGKTDFLRQEKGGWDNDDTGTFLVHLSRGNGDFDAYYPNTYDYQVSLKGSYSNLIPGYFNSDEKMDFICQEKSGWDDDDISTFKIYYSTGNGTFDIQRMDNWDVQYTMKGDYVNLIPGDFDGDGITDLIRQEKAGWNDDPTDNLKLYLLKQDKITRFSTNFENPESIPLFYDNVLYKLSVTGYYDSINPECSPRTNEGSHSGTTALLFSGTDTNVNASYCYYKVFDNVNLQVTKKTKLSYWFLPQNDNARHTAVDIEFTDGTTLRQAGFDGLTDQNGVYMHPAYGRGSVGQWNYIESNIGSKCAGKVIRKIMYAYDQPGSTGQYRGYVDDIRIWQ